jgi:hypothetical protein
MSNGRAHSRGTNQRTTTVLRDLNGEVILEIGLEEYIVRQPDGSIVFYRRSDNLRLVDGLQWNPGFLTANPPIFVGICHQCRTHSIPGLQVGNPSHGIASLARCKICAGCGTLSCPNHSRISPWDFRWRCLSCNRKHTVKETFKSIFYIRR